MGGTPSIRRTVDLGAGVLAVLALLTWPGSAAAATIKVTNRNNAGPGSLRRALAVAKDGDTIIVPAGTYKLTGQLVIKPSVTVTGAGAGKTVLTAGNRSRVLDIANSAANVTLTELAVTHGQASTGAGILSFGDLILSHVIVSANLASGGSGGNLGGGIANAGTLVIRSSWVSDNKTAQGTTEGLGAGIADTATGGSVTISGSVVSGNLAQGQGLGGALYFEDTNPPNGTTITITTTTVANNKALGAEAFGGGIYYGADISGSSDFPLTLTRDTFSGNVAGGGGNEGLGGALAYEPINDGTANLSLTMVNDTLTANRAGTSTERGLGGALDYGPAVGDGPATLNSTNVTIARNTADGPDSFAGGVIYEPLAGSGGTASATFVNTIIALNTAANDADCSDPIPSAGHNLETGTSCGFTGTGDLENTNPKLGQLANNGGPTETLALLPGSPAINAGSDAACPPIDQRGVPRPQGSHCDIGAYEFKP